MGGTLVKKGGQHNLSKNEGHDILTMNRESRKKSTEFRKRGSGKWEEEGHYPPCNLTVLKVL